MDFAGPTDQIVKVKVKEGEKLDHSKDVKKLWDTKVMVISIEVGALGTVPKKLEKKLV